MGYLLLFVPLLFIIGFKTTQKFQEPLDKEEEEKCLKLYTETKDEKARETLIERNLRLVVNIAKKYDNNKSDFEDLISIGIIGLIKGINTFKIEKENKLSTYVSKCIEKTILISWKHLIEWINWNVLRKNIILLKR